LAGFSSILVTNFFGFSVVPVAFLFFLYPAFAGTLAKSSIKTKANQQAGKSTSWQIALISLVLCSMFYSLFALSKYWLADLNYAKGKLNNDSGNHSKAREFLKKSVQLSSNEAVFWDELSQSSTGIALNAFETANNKLAGQFAESAIQESNKAIKLSSSNVNLKRNRANMFIKLSAINSKLLVSAKETLSQATIQAPTDAKLFYNLALAHIRIGNNEKAIEILKKTIDMKSDYGSAYFALGLIYIDENKSELAKEQFKYILENIDPDNVKVKRELDELS
jgi:tetratricopeptide (TPR) repeat protein